MKSKKKAASYRSRFTSADRVRDYASFTYAPYSYYSILGDLEIQQIRRIIDDRISTSFAYLDFACGTGRILGEIAPLAQTSRGIDVSDSMLEVAGRRHPRADLVNKDITADSDDIEGQYDVITAFRFILNAEPGLRLAALRALRARLRDPHSILIFNNHANLLSHKGLTAPYHYARKSILGATVNSYLTHAAIVGMCTKAGLHAERVAGCGLTGAHIAGLLGRDRSSALEAWFADSRFDGLGSNQMYVAYRAS